MCGGGAPRRVFGDREFRLREIGEPRGLALPLVRQSVGGGDGAVEPLRRIDVLARRRSRAGRKRPQRRPLRVTFVPRGADRAFGRRRTPGFERRETRICARELFGEIVLDFLFSIALLAGGFCRTHACLGGVARRQRRRRERVRVRRPHAKPLAKRLAKPRGAFVERPARGVQPILQRMLRLLSRFGALESGDAPFQRRGIDNRTEPRADPLDIFAPSRVAFALLRDLLELRMRVEQSIDETLDAGEQRRAGRARTQRRDVGHIELRRDAL